MQIKYAYLQSISVANGQEVTTDTVIGTTGSTGSATGSQLYLELVKDGEYYNPVFYISTGAVSYTHLDVYKRQMKSSPGMRNFLNLLFC